jgi:hypothetical protein
MWEDASKRVRLTTNIESRGSFEDDASFTYAHGRRLTVWEIRLNIQGGRAEYTYPFSMWSGTENSIRRNLMVNLRWWIYGPQRPRTPTLKQFLGSLIKMLEDREPQSRRQGS